MTEEKKTQKFKDYFISPVPTMLICLKEGKHHFDHTGKKVKEEADTRVRFKNARYSPKNDEENKLLSNLADSGMIKKVTVKEQQKAAELNSARAKAEAEIEKKFGDKPEDDKAE